MHKHDVVTKRKRELHAPQVVNGKVVRGSYIGPGTDLEERLKSKTRGVSPTDSVAKIHDLLYNLAESDKDTRTADSTMIDLLENINDVPANKYLGKMPIVLKTVAEDTGILDRRAFNQYPHGLSDSDKIKTRDAILDTISNEFEITVEPNDVKAKMGMYEPITLTREVFERNKRNAALGKALNDLYLRMDHDNKIQHQLTAAKLMYAKHGHEEYTRLENKFPSFARTGLLKNKLPLGDVLDKLIKDRSPKKTRVKTSPESTQPTEPQNDQSMPVSPLVPPPPWTGPPPTQVFQLPPYMYSTDKRSNMRLIQQDDANFNRYQRPDFI